MAFLTRTSFVLLNLMVLCALFVIALPFAYVACTKTSMAYEKNLTFSDGNITVEVRQHPKTDDSQDPKKQGDQTAKHDHQDADKSIPTSKADTDKKLRPTLSDSAPAWAELTDEQIRENVIVVKTELAHKDNVQKLIRQAVARAANDHIRETRGNKVAQYVSFSPDYVDKNFVGRRHIRRLSQEELAEIPPISADQDLQYVYGYAELVADDKFDHKVEQHWLQHKRTSRLSQLALFGFGGLAILAIAFAFFSANHATRGFYTVCLQFVSVIVVAVVAIALFFFAQNFHWL